MVGWRECAGCKKELPEELFREGSPQCRICARKEKRRNPVVRIARGITAVPREQWARALIARCKISRAVDTRRRALDVLALPVTEDSRAYFNKLDAAERYSLCLVPKTTSKNGSLQAWLPCAAMEMRGSFLRS